MKRFKSFIALGLAFSLTAIPVQAAETIQVTEATSQDVEVTAEVASSFTVTIPKTVTLSSATTGTGTYTSSIPVTVTGDIGTSEVITVDTEDTVELTDASNASKDPMTATVTKDKTEFNFTDLTGGQVASTSHAVSANLIPGEWSGTLPFYINLGEPVIEYTQLLFSWEPSDGYTVYNNADGDPYYAKLSADYLTVDEVAEGVKVVYTASDGNKSEVVCTEDNLGLILDDPEENDGRFGIQLITYLNIYDDSKATSWGGNGLYLYVLNSEGTIDDDISINNTEYRILEDCTIEIYGPAK